MVLRCLSFLMCKFNENTSFLSFSSLKMVFGVSMLFYGRLLYYLYLSFYWAFKERLPRNKSVLKVKYQGTSKYFKGS